MVDPAEAVEVAVDSGAARGAEPAGAGTWGAEPGGAETGGAESGGAESGRVEPGGAEPGRVEPEGAGATGATGGPAGASGSAAGASGGAVGAGAAGGATGAGGTAGASGRATGAGGTARVSGGAAGASAAGDAVGAGGAAGASGGAAGAGAAGGAANAGGAARAGAAGGAAGTGALGAEGTGFVFAVYGGAVRPRPYYVPLLQQVLGSPPSPGPPPPPVLNPQLVQSQSRFQPASPLPGLSPCCGPTSGLTEHREPESRPASPVRPVRAGRLLRPRPPPVPGTHSMTLRPSTALQRVPLPSPPVSSLPAGPDLASDSLRDASPAVTHFLATAVTNPFFESSAASALVAELVDFAAACRLDYTARLVTKSASVSVCPPSVGGMGLVLGGRARVVLTGHADASWVDDLTMQRSSQGYTFSLGSGSVSWQSARSSPVLSSSCEAEIYAGAMAAQELRWLTYLLTDLKEAPRSPPSLRAAQLSRAALLSRIALHCPTASAATVATAAPAATAITTAITAPTAAMASPTVLTFDNEGRTVDFDVWVDDQQLFLQCDSRDGVSLFDHTSGVSTTLDATADIARYSSPATAALSRLMLPYLFFEGCSPVPLLPSLASAAVVDLVGTEEVEAAVVEGAAGEAVEEVEEADGVAVVVGVVTESGGFSGGGGGGGGSGSGGGGGGSGGAGRGAASQRGGFGDAWRARFTDATELPRWHDLLLQNVPIFDFDFDAILAAIYALTDSAEGECYLSVPPDSGIAAAALGASASSAPRTGESAAQGASEFALSGTAPTEALHTFTLDSGASRSFFRDSTTLTPLGRPVAVSLADPSGGPVLAHSSTVLPCPAAPSGLLSGLHLPAFSTNLVSGADL
ncbi:unnamed protein product [Closterium sp. NIES-54]